MRIIVEGVDGIGKSTLCKKLSKAFGAAIVHNTANTANTVEYYHALTIVPKLIQDRGFISEIIYSKVFNRKCQLNEADKKLLEFSYFGPTDIIILYSKKGFYVQNNKDEPRFLQNKQHEINEMYKLYAESHYPVTLINVDDLSADEVYAKALEAIR